VAVLVLTVLQLIFGLIFGMGANLSAIGWILLANLLIVLVLSCPVVHSHTFGLKLAGVIFLLFFGIYGFNNNIETIFFQLSIPQNVVFSMILESLFVALIFSLAFVFLMGKMRKPGTKAETVVRSRISIIGYVWRFIVCDITYVILYLIAGVIIYPYIKGFYAELAQIPDPGQLLLMQLFRGLVYIIAVLPIIRMMNIKRIEIMIMVGLQFAVLASIAPLLLPNPYMSTYIRTIHAFEIGISNFIFGLMVGALFSMRPLEKISHND